MDDRDRAYLWILAIALVRIRNSAMAGDARNAAIEADHVHNIPTLISEPNEKRHQYYIFAERPDYVALAKTHGISVARYEEHWNVIQAITASRQ